MLLLYMRTCSYCIALVTSARASYGACLCSTPDLSNGSESHHLCSWSALDSSSMRIAGCLPCLSPCLTSSAQWSGSSEHMLVRMRLTPETLMTGLTC